MIFTRISITFFLFRLPEIFLDDILLLNRPQLQQNLIPIIDIALFGYIQKRKRFHIAKPQGHQPQNHTRQIAA